MLQAPGQTDFLLHTNNIMLKNRFGLRMSWEVWRISFKRLILRVHAYLNLLIIRSTITCSDQTLAPAPELNNYNVWLTKICSNKLNLMLQKGAMTFSIMTLGMLTPVLMTHCTETLFMLTLSIIIKFQHSALHLCYTNWYRFIGMLSIPKEQNLQVCEHRIYTGLFRLI